MTIIGADSMGSMGPIAPMAKKLWGRCPEEWGLLGYLELFIIRVKFTIYYFLHLNTVCQMAARLRAKSAIYDCLVGFILVFIFSFCFCFHYWYFLVLVFLNTMFIFHERQFLFSFLLHHAVRCVVLVIVVLSVCMSHSWTVSTWFDLRSWFLY